MILDELLKVIPKNFDPKISESINANIQINALGDEGGNWFITIIDNQSMINKGEIESPDFLITAKNKDLIDIFSGEIDGIQAYMQGKINFSGNMGLAIKMFKLISLHRTFQNIK